jgi:type III secretion system YscQ/HrcQ family protein
MHTALKPRQMPYRFDGLPSFTREQVALWNWYCRIAPDRTEWTSWIANILGHLLEHPADQQLQLVQTHMVDPDFGEKILSLGSKAEFFLGRGPDNDVVLPAKAIANKHVRLILTKDHLSLEDLGGKLGTYVWDKRIPPREAQAVRDGDQFSVFPYRFRVSLQTQWRQETDIILDRCRIQPLNRAEFLALSPAGWRVFVVNSHPSDEGALLEMSPEFLVQLRQRILGPLKIENAAHTVPSDDTLLAFVMLALLERLNRRLKFPIQFSFSRASAKARTDDERGVFLSSAVFIGGLTGQFRVFLPLNFLANCKPASQVGWQGDAPPALGWRFPIAIGFVDLSPDEVAQIGLGDILVAESAIHVLFPGNFTKGWAMSADPGNQGRFRVDKYFERSLLVETGGDTTTAGSTADIGSLPFRLHVVLGEKEFTLAEIQSLSPGTIVELEIAKSNPVRLMVNGRILGEGQLVDVEGKLAVKVLGWKSA